MKYLLERPCTTPGGCDTDKKQYRIIALPDTIPPPGGAKRVDDDVEPTDGWVSEKPAEPLAETKEKK